MDETFELKMDDEPQKPHDMGPRGSRRQRPSCMMRSISNQASINAELDGWDLVRTGRLEDLKNGLKPYGRIDPLLRGVFGENMLHYALLCQQSEIANFLIDNKHWNWRLIEGTYGPKEGRDLSEIPVEAANALNEYAGENCLHFAIANHDMSTLRHVLRVVKELDPLAENLLPKILQQKVTGRFFRGEFNDTVYLGQTPLHFAVCTHQPKAVALILEVASKVNFGAKNEEDRDVTASNGSLRILNDRDMYGNTCFHLSVLYGQKELWDMLQNHLAKILMLEDKEPSDWEAAQHKIFRTSSWMRKQRNIADMTPIQFCVYVNNVDLFEHIINSTRLSIWKWGNRSFNAYNLAEIDSYKDLDLDRFEGMDVLTLVVTEAHFDFMRLTFINNVLEDKWTKYGRKGVYFFLTLQMVFCLAMALYFMTIFPDFDNLEKDWGVAAIHGFWPVFTTIFVVAKSLLEITIEFLELGGLIKIYGLGFGAKIFLESPLAESSFIGVLVNGAMIFFKCCFKKKKKVNKETFLSYMSKYGANLSKKEYPSTTGFLQLLRVLSNTILLTILVLLVIGFGSWGYDSPEEAHAFALLLIMALIFEFFQVFMFLQNVKSISRFVASMVAMLVNDFMGFVGVLTVILLAFSFTMALVWQDNIFEIMFIMLELGIGTGEFYFNEYDKHHGEEDVELDIVKRNFTWVLFASYILIMVLVMLNLLIAVMSETAINMLGETFHLRQRMMGASTIMMVERRLVTLRYYVDKVLYLFACEKFETHEEWEDRREGYCCIFPPEDPDHHEHPWTEFMYKRTGVPGRELCKSIKFDEEVADDLKLNYIFNVLDPISDPEEKDDVVLEESSLEKAATLFEKEIDNCDDLCNAQKRVRVIEHRLFGRMQRLVNDADGDSKTGERLMRRSLLETLLSAKSKGQMGDAHYIS